LSGCGLILPPVALLLLPLLHHRWLLWLLVLAAPAGDVGVVGGSGPMVEEDEALDRGRLLRKYIGGAFGSWVGRRPASIVH
jgi:hypothetical protein